MTQRAKHPNDLCGADCRYRSLYEGSQSSLSDMAARQAEALGSHGRLRNGLVAALKASFPRQFVQAELAMGRRFADCDDAVLVAYVQAFAEPVLQAPPVGEMAVLRGVLASVGFALPPEDDPASWAKAVRSQQASLEPPVARPGDLSGLFDVAPAMTDTASMSAASMSTPAGPADRTVVAATRPESSRGAAKRRSGRSGRTKAQPDPAATWEAQERAPIGNEPVEDGYEAYQEPHYDHSAPASGGAPDETAPEEATSGASDGGPGNSSADESSDTLWQEIWGDDNGGEGVQTETARGLDAPAIRAAKSTAAEPTSSEPTSSEPTRQKPVASIEAETAGPRRGVRSMRAVLVADGWPDPGVEDARAFVERTPGGRTTFVPEPTNAAALSDLFADDTPSGGDAHTVPSSHWSRVPAAPVATAPEATPTTGAPVPLSLAPPVQAGSSPASQALSASGTRRSGGDGPLRPEMLPMLGTIPKTRRRNASKTIRVAASAPDATVGGPTEGAAGDARLTDATRDALVAQVAVPRPVFTSDLAVTAGSDDLVRAWESECLSNSASAVRFIPPKSRHRARGALVIPYAYAREAAAEFNRSWWAGCLERYRGAKLYELGVLLHRVGEQVVSHHLGEHTVMLRLRQPRGLVGVVVTLDPKLTDDDGSRAALVADVEELLSERLELLVVLTTNAEVIERAETILVEEAAKRSWAPSMTIVAARSWEYAAQNNAAIRHVLG